MLIAQVSDTHLVGGSETLGVLARVMDWLGELSPDAVVVTGDVIEDGWTEGYEVLARHLSRLACPSFVLPGNSDLSEAMRGALNTAADGPLHFASTVGGVPIIGLDVTVAGQPYGDALPHLGWLEKSLSDADAPAMIFMHQPPILSGIDAMDVSRCRHSGQLLAVLEAAKHRPLGVFCGHVHRPIFGRLGAVGVALCGSLCPPNPLLLGDAKMPPITDGPSILVHEVLDGAVRSHIVGFAV